MYIVLFAIEINKVIIFLICVLWLRYEPGVPREQWVAGPAAGGSSPGGPHQARPRIRGHQEQDQDQRQQLHRYHVRQASKVRNYDTQKLE